LGKSAFSEAKIRNYLRGFTKASLAKENYGAATFGQNVNLGK
jgi:hypothetical protein